MTYTAKTCRGCQIIFKKSNMLEPSCILRCKVVYSSRIELLPCMVKQKYVPATCDTGTQMVWNNDLVNDNALWSNVIQGNERSSEITRLYTPCHNYPYS